MTELLSKFTPSDLIGLVAVTGGLLCGITGIIMGVWHQVRQAEIAVALKQDMLDRGMSPDDIRTVVEAGLKGSQNAVRGYSSCKA